LQCVYSKEYATLLSQECVKNGIEIKIHIKLDTGMSRLGFNCRSDELLEIDDAVYSANLTGLKFDGIFTHFANADTDITARDGFTEQQYSRFKKAVQIFKENGFTPNLVHCCNSAGFLLDSDKHSDLCRVGISLYGLTPSTEMTLKTDLTPVMTVKSVVSMVKEINKGDTVNYGRTFKAQEKMKIATISAGYADGYPRILSNKGFVLINGKKANIIGRICMDQMCVDVSDNDTVKMGDEVILFGKELIVDSLADLAETINYEITCGISPRVPRIIKG
jgi:alanine racemase